VSNRLVELPLLKKENAEIVMGVSVGGIEFERFLIVSNSLLRLAFAKERVPKIVMDLGSGAGYSANDSRQANHPRVGAPPKRGYAPTDNIVE
jgi:hypothetical protein